MLKASLSAAVDCIRSLTTVIRKVNGTSVPALQAAATSGAAGELGMSFEVTNVVLAEPKAEIWKLVKVTFTGAAILRREKAAYQKTWIGLS
jgi:hypothetical protein